MADTAFARARERERPETERLFDDPYAPLFAAAGEHAAEGTKRFLDLPFFLDGLRLRTRFIDDFVRHGLADGLGQLVLLGAGFDARGLRMPEIERSGATVYEIDSPDQLARKRAILAAAGVTLPPVVKYVPFDFATPDFVSALTLSLTQQGFRSGAGALFVWEGVIGYIDKPAIEQSLRFMAHAGGQASRLVFTFGPATFDPETAADSLRRAGFASCEELGMDQVWPRYLPGDPHPNASVSKLGTALV